MRHVLFALAAASITISAPQIVSAQTINQRQADLNRRIEMGIQNRSLTQAEASQLRSEFAAIAQLEARYRASGRGLTAAERKDLDNRFDLLSRRIRYERHDDANAADAMNINQRQRDLDAKIDAGVQAGGLTASEARMLRADFQAIARDEARYRASGRGLTQAERASLEQRLDVLERRISRNRADGDRRWTNLDQRQADFDRKLDQAVRDRRVNAREAAALRSEFRNIAQLERQYRKSRPGITAAERADLNRRFDRMEANFRASMTPADNLFDLLFGLTR